MKNKNVSNLIHGLLAFICFCLGIVISGCLKEMYISHQMSCLIDDGLSYDDSLRYLILQTGDTVAYQKLKKQKQDDGLPQEIWFYSIVMAKKHQYPSAYFDVYYLIKNLYDTHPNWGTIDIKTEKIIKQFVNEGNNLNH